MGVLTNIIAAEDDEVYDIGESLEPLVEWSGIQRRGIDTAKIATLHRLLTGDDFEVAASVYEPVYVSTGDVIVLRIADDVLEKLVELDQDALERVADELAATEEFEQEAWPAEEVTVFVFDLAELAHLAESQGQALFVWMHPLMT